MTPFECHLNWRFWRSKKVVQVVQIGGGGGPRKFGKNPKEKLLFSWSLPVPVCNALLFLRPIVIEFLSHVHTCGGFSLVAAWDESHQRLTDVCLSKCRLELEPDFVIVVCVFVLDCWIVVNTTWACAWGGFVLCQDLGYCPIVHLSVLCPPFSIKLLLKHKC